MAITAHFICDWKMNSVLLDCFNFSERHELLNVVRSWEVSEKIYTVVSDNAYNITAVVKLTGWTHLPCLAHTLKLVVQDSLKIISPLQQKVKKIVEYSHRSSTAATKLMELQEQFSGKKLKLINDLITRWNSTYFMFRRICQ